MRSWLGQKGGDGVSNGGIVYYKSGSVAFAVGDCRGSELTRVCDDVRLKIAHKTKRGAMNLRAPRYIGTCMEQSARGRATGHESVKHWAQMGYPWIESKKRKRVADVESFQMQLRSRGAAVEVDLKRETEALCI